MLYSAEENLNSKDIASEKDKYVAIFQTCPCIMFGYYSAPFVAAGVNLLR